MEPKEENIRPIDLISSPALKRELCPVTHEENIGPLDLVSSSSLKRELCSVTREENIGPLDLVSSPALKIGLCPVTREENIGPLDLVSSPTIKRELCSVTCEEAGGGAASTNRSYENCQSSVPEDVTPNGQLYQPYIVRIKEEPEEEPPVADIHSSVVNDDSKGGRGCSTEGEIPIQSKVFGFKNEDACDSTVGEVPLNLCSKVYIKEEEDLSSQDDIVSEDSDDDTDTQSGQHFSAHYTVEVDEAPKAFGLTHAVFIKEEVSERDSFESEATPETSEADINTFGNHFLTQCLEPRQPQYQYANGLPAENECDSSLDLSLPGLHALQREQMGTNNDDSVDNEASHLRGPIGDDREHTTVNTPSGSRPPVELSDAELDDSTDSEGFSGSDSYDVNYEFSDNSSSSEEDTADVDHSVVAAGDGGRVQVTGSANGYVDSCRYNETDYSTCEWRNIGEYKTCSSFGDYSKSPKVNFQLVDPRPIDVFGHFITDELWDCMVLETNRFAEHYLADRAGKPSALGLPWTNTTVAEMKQFVGVMISMGLTELPSLDMYWSTNKLYSTKLISNVISKDRFILLKRFWNFEDNKTVKLNASDDLIKIRNFVNKLNLTFFTSLTPGKDLVIHDTLIPWREVFFHRYVPSQNHKDGVTVCKLCTKEGYTLKVFVDTGKSEKSSASHSFDIVMELMDGIFKDGSKVFAGFLDKGLHLYAGDFYTGIILAEKLLERKTCLCGAVRESKKIISSVIVQDLNKGEHRDKECQHGTKLIKWKDQLMISTLSDHKSALVNSGKMNRKGQPILKPQIMLDYNSAIKDIVFINDEMSSHFLCLRKSLKWYKKVLLQLIRETCVVNSWIVYRMMSGTNIKLHKFMESIALSLMAVESVPVTSTRKRPHSLSKMDGQSRNTRRRCTVCYQLNRRTLSVKEAARKTKQVSLYCEDCPNKPFMCLACFNSVHNQ